MMKKILSNEKSGDSGIVQSEILRPYIAPELKILSSISGDTLSDVNDEAQGNAVSNSGEAS